MIKGENLVVWDNNVLISEMVDNSTPKNEKKMFKETRHVEACAGLTFSSLK